LFPYSFSALVPIFWNILCRAMLAEERIRVWGGNVDLPDSRTETKWKRCRTCFIGELEELKSSSASPLHRRRTYSSQDASARPPRCVVSKAAQNHASMLPNFSMTEQECTLYLIGHIKGYACFIKEKQTFTA
jgi:hypothetical protein